MEEQQAIHLLKKGDLSGLDELVSLYYFRAVKTAFLIVQDRDEAEDVVQNAFLHAFEKINQLESERFGPWFLRSVVNAALKTAKKHQQRLSLEATPAGSASSFEQLLADEQPSPETQVEMDELRQVIWQALQQLSVEQRAAVVLKYYLELSEVEITAVLAQPQSTIKWRLYAARQRLKNLLHPYAPPAKTNPRLSIPDSKKQD